MQEISYKILTQWYITPQKKRRWSSPALDTCWRCCSDTGTFLHMWWTCSSIPDFWQQIIRWITQIMDTPLVLDASAWLLHINSHSLWKCKRSLTRYLLNTAKALIPIYWKSTYVPTVKDWFAKVNTVYNMKETLAR